MEATAIRAVSAPTKIDWIDIARDLGPRFAARAAEVDEEDLFVSENFAELKAAGLISAGVPAELGGGGASHAELGAVLQEFGRTLRLHGTRFRDAHASGRDRRLALALPAGAG